MTETPALADRHVPAPRGIRRCLRQTETILAPLVILLLVALTATAGRAAEAMPTFAEWQAACAKLPLNRVLAGRMPPKALLPLQTFAEFDRVLDAFFALATQGPLADAALWVGTAPRRDTFLDFRRTWFTSPKLPFEPFAEKLALPTDGKVVIQGDLHGDIHSLLGVLRGLQERKWLDGFALTEPGLHLVFLGDYTDRGLYGVEVLYTLFRLKLANPDRVHLGRGNHEEIGLVSRYGFLAEGRAKYGPEFNAAKLLRAYDLLPVVTYVGTEKDFVQLCHGGMEPGFSPGPLLAAAGPDRFQLLGALRQKAFLRADPDWLKGDPASAALAARNFQDFTPETPTSPTTIGFMWNDFTVFRDEPAFGQDPTRAFVYGQAAVRHLLRAAGSDGAALHAVIRAHQHSSAPNPMMHRLLAGRGLFRHWQETDSAAARDADPAALKQRLETAASRSIPDGSVWTLNVVPDSVYGVGVGFNFASFAVLRLGPTFGDWRIGVETVDVPTR